MSRDLRSKSISTGGSRILKIISAITLFSFLLTTGMGEVFVEKGWAAMATPIPSTVPTVDTFYIPYNLGSIENLSDAGSEKLVIHIQDAHCDYAAQHKIAEIIKYLNKEYGIDIVNFEGGKGNNDLSIFTSISDKRVREKVADYFVKKGVVNGAEYFAINNPGKIKLWGMEETDLYLENLNVYRESLQHKDEIDRNMDILQHILDNLKTRIYPKELFELDSKCIQYKEKKIEPKEYFAYLIQKAHQRHIDITPFQNIQLMNQILEEEKKIDFTKANIERDALLERMQGVLSRNEMRGLTEKALDLENERIPKDDFYAYLTKKAMSMGLDLKDFPALGAYVTHIAKNITIDWTRIMEEAVALEERIKETLYQNTVQKELNSLSRIFMLMRDMFNVSLKSADYEYYKTHKEFFRVKRFISFIEKHAPAFGITANFDRSMERVDLYWDKISRFYECSLTRDEAFLQNAKFVHGRRLRGKGSFAAIMVTGGFHAENLYKLFKREGISCISITPNFKNTEAYECPYFRLLAGKDSGLLKYVTASMSTIAIWSYFNENAVEIYGMEDGLLEEVRDEWVRIVTAFLRGEKEVVMETPGGTVRFELCDEDETPDKGRARKGVREERVCGWTEGKAIWAIWDPRQTGGTQRPLAEIPTAKQLRDVLEVYKPFFDAAGFSELYLNLEKLFGDEVSFTLDTGNLSYITKKDGKDKEDFGYIKRDGSKNQIVISSYFWDELQEFAEKRNLSERQRLEYLLGFVIELFVESNRIDKREVNAFISRINNSKKIRARLASISSVFTGTERYVYFYSEGNWEGILIFLVYRWSNRLKQKLYKQKQVQTKEVSGLDYFLDHLRDKNKIRRKRGAVGLTAEDEKILDNLRDTDNPELREVALWALSKIKPDEYSKLEEKADKALRRFLRFTQARRVLLFLSSALFIVMNGSFTLVMTGLVEFTSFVVAPLSVPYLFLIVNVFFPLIQVSQIYLDQQLPSHKNFKKYYLLHSLLLADRFKGEITAGRPEGQDLGVDFDNPSYDRIFRAENGKEISVWEAASKKLMDLEILQMMEAGVLDDDIFSKTREKQELKGKFLNAKQDIDTDKIGWDDILELLATVRNGLTEKHIQAYYLGSEKKQTIDDAKAVARLMEKREDIEEAIEKIKTNTLFNKGDVRVKIWDRNPWLDLSNARELYACCFMGGIAENDILTFISHRSISMMDFYTKTGRKNRVFLAAAYREVDGKRKPVLLAFDVEGRRSSFISTTITQAQKEALNAKADVLVGVLEGALKHHGIKCDPEVIVRKLINEKLKDRAKFSTEYFFELIKDLIAEESKKVVKGRDREIREVSLVAKTTIEYFLKDHLLRAGVEINDDNVFIQEMIEEYAREAGFEAVVYNRYLVNMKPVEFIESVEKRGSAESVSNLWLSLLTPENTVNLETFGYPLNSFLRLLKRLFGLIHIEAAKGIVKKGYIVEFPVRKTGTPDSAPEPAVTAPRLASSPVHMSPQPMKMMVKKGGIEEKDVVGYIHGVDTARAVEEMNGVLETVREKIPEDKFSIERISEIGVIHENSLAEMRPDPDDNTKVKMSINHILLRSRKNTRRKILMHFGHEISHYLIRQAEEGMDRRLEEGLANMVDLNSVINARQGMVNELLQGLGVAEILGDLKALRQMKGVRGNIKAQRSLKRYMKLYETLEKEGVISEKVVDVLVNDVLRKKTDIAFRAELMKKAGGLGIIVHSSASETPVAAAIGKVTDSSGNIIEKGLNAERIDTGLRVTHKDMEEPIDMSLATDEDGAIATRDKGEVVESICRFVDERKEVPPAAQEKIGQLIDSLQNVREVVLIEHDKKQNKIKGIFSDGILYLDEYLVNDPLGLIHELGEGFVELPQGKEYEVLTRHTFMRGAGKDVRNAYDALVTGEGNEKMDSHSPDGLISKLDAKMREPDFVLSKERSLRLGRGESPLTESEKALIRYNAGLKDTDGRNLKGKALLFGIQDHLDPGGNVRFTHTIRLLTDDLRQGVLNVFLLPSSELPGAKAGMAEVAKDARKEFRKKYGNNTSISYYTKGEDFSAKLNGLIEWALGEDEKKKGESFPKIFVYCTTAGDVKRVNDFINTSPENVREICRDMIMIGNDSEGGEKAVVDEVKVITVGAALMNDKRLADFGLSPQELFESRRRLFGFLSANEIISEEVPEDAGVYHEYLDKIWKGIALLRITRINWESLREWRDAQNQVLQSL